MQLRPQWADFSTQEEELQEHCPSAESIDPRDLLMINKHTGPIALETVATVDTGPVFRTASFLKWQLSLRSWFERVPQLTCAGGSSTASQGQTANGAEAPQQNSQQSSKAVSASACGYQQGACGGSGSDPPEDRRRNSDPNSGHYVPGEYEDKKKKENKEKLAEAMKCASCCRLPSNNQLHIVAQKVGEGCFGRVVCCSKSCAEKELTGDEVVIAVRFLEGNPPNVRGCNVCWDDDKIWIPLAVCSSCRQYQCESCCASIVRINDQWSCSNKCKEASCGRLTPPSSICNLANMKVMVRAETNNFSESDAHLEQRRQQYIEHLQRELDRENEMLAFHNSLQDLFNPEVENQATAPQEESDLPQELSANDSAPLNSQDEGRSSSSIERYLDDEAIEPEGEAEISSTPQAPVGDYEPSNQEEDGEGDGNDDGDEELEETDGLDETDGPEEAANSQDEEISGPEVETNGLEFDMDSSKIKLEDKPKDEGFDD